MCNCLEKANDTLSKDGTNTQLRIVETFGKGMKHQGSRLVIATEKIDSKSRIKAIPIFATFCPFCGDKLDTRD